MSKSVLVIDTPTNCWECPCFMDEGWRCQCRLDIDEDVHDGRPDWCPLKEESSTEVIPIKWLTDKIDKAHDELFELTKDKNRSFSYDELFTFKSLDLYVYALEQLYYDYTGTKYKVNHYMLRNSGVGGSGSDL